MNNEHGDFKEVDIEPAPERTNALKIRALQTKQKRTTSLPSALAPESEAMLNLWRDFRKVMKFIDINRGWLEPLLEQAKVAHH